MARVGVALGVGVEHVVELHHREFVHALEAGDGAGDAAFAGDLGGALGDVLGEVADALEIAGDAHRPDDLAQVDRDGLPAGDDGNRLLLDVALERIEPGSAAITWCASSAFMPASASMASASIFSAIPPISEMWRPSNSSSASKDLTV